MSVFTSSTRREQIVSSLDDKTFRDAFVADQIRIGVPIQIKQMREELQLSQEQLGQQIQPPMVQESVWRLENPNKANLTIGTLLRVASAFDVALVVRFVPFSELIDSTPWLSGRTRAVPSYSKDAALRTPMMAQTTDVIRLHTGVVPAMGGLSMAPAVAMEGVVTYSYSVPLLQQQTLTSAANTQLAKVA